MNHCDAPLSFRRFGAALAALAVGSCAPLGVQNGTDCTDGMSCPQPAQCRAGQASAQFVKQVGPPPVMGPWRRASVSLTFANCSGQTWQAGSFALRPAHGIDAGTWGVARVPLPVDVPDGQQLTIPFEVTAPDSTGAFMFSWAIAHEGVELFQEPSEPVPVHVVAVADCSTVGPEARFRAQTTPARFVATNSPVHASATFANCGPSPWSADVALTSRGDPGDAWGPTTIALPFDVPPQSEVAIPIEGVAPGKPGRYPFAWQLARGGNVFGDPTPPTESIVLDGYDCSHDGPPARFVSQTDPGELDPGQSVDVNVRFANCSDGEWDDSFSLDSALDNHDRPWGVGPIPLSLPIGSGFAIDVPFQIHAPGSPGFYGYQWGIEDRGGTILDDPGPRLDLHVRCIPQCGDHNCGGDGCGGSCGGCPGGWSCDGAHCQPPQMPDLPQCGLLQWWNRGINYEHVVSGWNDTDLNVAGSTPIQLRHDSRLDHWGIYGWGYMPEFTDLVTGVRFRMLHLRPQHTNATTVGHVYPAGFVVGLSGGDTQDTGLPVYSSGAHLCIQTLVNYFQAFPRGDDPCR